MAEENLYQYFKIEAREIVGVLSRDILALERGDAGAEPVARLLRQAHTLKGAARVVRLPRIAEIAHAMEDALAPHRDTPDAVSKEQIGRLLLQVDNISSEISALDPAPPAGTVPRPAALEPFERVRVGVAEMDALLSGVSETAVQLDGIRRGIEVVKEVEDRLAAFQQQLTDAKPGPRLHETVEEMRLALQHARQGLGMRADSTDREVAEVRGNIDRLRLLPTSLLLPALERAVRDAADTLGKQVVFNTLGREQRLESHVLSALGEALSHLVRNAVAHGIEERRIRERSGKSEKGLVSVRAYHRGNHIFIEVEDDGRGIDYDGARRRVVEMGAMSSVAAAELTERELREFLFRPGFTTAAAMTELAGRGVGLDVVRANVHALNGEIEVRSEPGHGATFTVKVPLTLIISQALFVRCGTSIFALPLAVVEEIRRLKPGEIEDVGGKLLTRVRDVVTEVVRLDVQLALPPLEPLNGYFHMVIVKVAGKQVGVVVEEVLGKDEIVIKNLGDYLRSVKLFPGTTIAPDGSLILLIDLNRLASADTAERNALPAASPAARVFAPGAEAVAAGSIPAGAVDSIQNDRVVVVADDSISVRKFVGRMLEKAGYRVRLASDGLEASEIVAQIGCHLVITDLEMPRMNGYELMAHLRQNPATRKVPVLVVTSRAGAKHRDRAMKEGAAAFLTKPVQEDQLVSTVDDLIGAEKPEIRRTLNVPVRQD